MTSTTEKTNHTQSNATSYIPTQNEEEESEESNELEYEDSEEEAGSGLEDGNLDLIPNDFNIATIGSFIERDIIKAPFYQRHYVWNLRKASLFIESLLFGLPVPTIFLQDTTKENRKKYDIVDGQQRLLTIYFFTNNVFPKNDEATNRLKEDREIKDIISDKSMFSEFKLNLPLLHSIPSSESKHGKYHGCTYNDLGKFEHEPVKENFDLTTIPTTTIKITNTDNQANKIYEIYRRLNTGGVRLRPQQVRVAIYSSEFYDLLHSLNKDKRWRNMIGKKHVSKTMADLEALLRASAFLMRLDDYRGSMENFLNSASYKMAKPENKNNVELLGNIFSNFLDLSKNLSFSRKFKNKKTGKIIKRFSVPAFESIFSVACEEAWKYKDAEKIKSIDPKKLSLFLENDELTKLLSRATNHSDNVKERYELAKNLLA